MSFPKVRPTNPDHQQLIADILADPTKAMCPICGQRGFWDNREGKKNPKSPDFKCRNKECPGATPLKGKSPYAVWLPEGFTDAPATPSKRLAGPSNSPTFDEAVPLDEPPAFHREVPLPDSPDGVPDKVGFTEGATAKELAYYALATRVAAFQQKISEIYEAPFDLASVNAMTFSIFNQR